jgi:hypothetical protein
MRCTGKTASMNTTGKLICDILKNSYAFLKDRVGRQHADCVKFEAVATQPHIKKLFAHRFCRSIRDYYIERHRHQAEMVRLNQVMYGPIIASTSPGALTTSTDKDNNHFNGSSTHGNEIQAQMSHHAADAMVCSPLTKPSSSVALSMSCHPLQQRSSNHENVFITSSRKRGYETWNSSPVQVAVKRHHSCE